MTQRKRRINKLRVSLAALTLLLVAGLPAAWFVHRKADKPNHSPISAKSARAAQPQKNNSKDQRAVFKYSVVPGGVRSQAELAAAAKRDPIVRRHYQGIHLDDVKETHLDHDMQAYVSYRVKDKIYWTQRKLNLHKGELVLTDGKNMVRGRCGNRVSLTKVIAPPGPEPSDPEFDVTEAHPPAVAAPPVAVASVGKGHAPGVAPILPAAVGSSVLPSAVASHSKLPYIIPAALVGGAVGSLYAKNSGHHGNSFVPPVVSTPNNPAPPVTPPVIPPTTPPVTNAPEPSASVWLLALGFGWLFVWSRRKTSKRPQ
jgi:hypothetical protein